MKRHDPQQGLFGGPPDLPRAVPVPPDRVADELPGQGFLALGEAHEPALPRNLAPVVLPPLDVLKATRELLSRALLGWHKRHYWGAAGLSRMYAHTDLECIVWQEAPTAWGWAVLRPGPKGGQEPVREARKPCATLADAQRASLDAAEAHLAPADWRRGLDTEP